MVRESQPDGNTITICYKCGQTDAIANFLEGRCYNCGFILIELIQRSTSMGRIFVLQHPRRKGMYKNYKKWPSRWVNGNEEGLTSWIQ